MFSMWSKKMSITSNKSSKTNTSKKSAETNASLKTSNTDTPITTTFDTFGNLTQDQLDILAEFKKQVVDNGIDESEFDSWYLHRFLLAKKWNLKNALDMFTEFIAQREKHNIENILSFDDSNARNRLANVFTENFVGIDKFDRPIKIQKYHQIDKENVYGIGYDQWWKYNCKSSEELIHIVFPFCSKLAKERVDQMVLVVDFADCNLGSMIFDNKLQKFQQICTEVGQNHYPEILGQMWIINAPFIFSGIFAVAKHFLSAKTLDKIKILGSNYQDELVTELGAENLPEYMGGKVSDWANKKMPWAEYQDYCNKKERFYHNDQPRVSDPLAFAEINSFDPDYLESWCTQAKSTDNEEENLSNKNPEDENIPESNDKNQNLENSDEFMSNESISDDKVSFYSANDEEIIEIRSVDADNKEKYEEKCSLED